MLNQPELPVGRLPNLSRATVAWISVAIAGNVVISLALNCQKLAHRRLERERGWDSDAERDRSKCAAGGEGRIDEEEEGSEVTPTENDPLARREHQITAAADGVLGLETDPLLPSRPFPDTSANYNTNGTYEVRDNARPASLWSRLLPWRKRASSAASDFDRSHIGAAHSLMPVDVVVARPANGRNGNRPGDPDKIQDSSANANLSDYLRSKL